MNPAGSLVTGKYRFRYCATPHLPHGWDAGVLFEESSSTLFCSDLFHHLGDVEPVTSSDIVGRVREALTAFQAGPLANYVPYTNQTESIFRQLQAVKPNLLATMHGSSFSGNGEQALGDPGIVMREVLNP